MDKWIAINELTVGRDKIARLVQYLSRAVWDTLEKSDYNPALIDQFKTLEYILSSFRKLLRFGKYLDVFYASLRTIHHQDLIIRVTLTISKLSQSLFLIGDHLLWLSRTGLFKTIDPKKWGKFANRYWLLSIVMNLSRDLYEIVRLIDLHKACGKAGIVRSTFPISIRSQRDLLRFALHAYVSLYSHRDVVVDTMKNVCDVFIPLTALGYTKLSPRTIGILGAMSSIAGLIVLIEPKAKLVPS